MSAHALILGIDPGISRTGWGVIARDRGRLRAIGAGVVRPRGKALSARLLSLSELLTEVVRQYRPTEVAIEDIFHHRHARSALILGHARGAALVSLARAGFDPVGYPPAMVKRVVAGAGNADKARVGRAVRGILAVEASVDALDALAVAICHVLAGRGRQMLREG